MKPAAGQLALFDAEPAPAPSPRGADGWRSFDDGIHRFAWQLRRASRRSIGIRVDDAGVMVSAPRWAALAQVHAVLADKADWVARQLGVREQRRHAAQAARIEWRDGGVLPYLGRHLTLRLGAAGAAPTLRDDALHLPLPPDSEPARVRDSTQAWMQRQARALFGERSAHFAEQLGVTVRAVRLTSATTRWGSASPCGTLRLHWRLLHFSPAVVDYVVAHEVAHLREMNHGPAFWAAVGELFPDWRDVRRQLRGSVLPPW